MKNPEFDYVLIYEKEFMNYGDGDLNGANYNIYPVGLYDMTKISQHSINRIKEVFTKNIEKRQYKSEGRFWTYVSKENLPDWGITL